MQVQHTKIDVKKSKKKSQEPKSTVDMKTDKTEHGDVHVELAMDSAGSKIVVEPSEDGNQKKVEKKVKKEKSTKIDLSDKEYADLYVEKNGDVNSDGKVTDEDSTYLEQALSKGKKINVDINKDGKTDYKDNLILKNYLSGKDVSLDLNYISFLEFSKNKELENYRARKKELKAEIDEWTKKEKLVKEDPLEFSEGEKKQISDKLQQYRMEMATLGSAIRSTKKVIAQIPYTEKMKTKEYADFASKYKSNWQADVNYDEIAQYYIDNGGDMSNYPFQEGVDWLSVVEYLVEEKDVEIGEYNNFRDFYLKYSAMSESQRMMYHYLFKTEGREAADKYIEVLQDDINQYIGTMRAQEWFDQMPKKVVEEVVKDEDGNAVLDEDGKPKTQKRVIVDTDLQSIISSLGLGADTGMKNFYEGIFQWNDDCFSADYYKKMAIMGYLEENGFLDNVYNTGTVVGEVGIEMSVSMFLSMMGCPRIVSSAATNAISTFSAGGQAYFYAKMNDGTSEQAMEYAKQTMKNQAITNAFSNIPGVGVSIGKLGKIGKAINVIGAGVTSSYEVYQDAKLREAILNESINMDEVSEDAFKAFVQSAAMAGFFEGTGKVFDIIKGEETFSFSSEDCINYFLDNPDATIDDLISDMDLYMQNGKAIVFDSETGANSTIDFNEFMSNKNKQNKGMNPISQPNTIQGHTFDYDFCVDQINSLIAAGKTDQEIVSALADWSNASSEIENKRIFGDISYEFLISQGYEGEEAATMVDAIYSDVLSTRGMSHVYTDSNGIKYNQVNGFNSVNQAYTIAEIESQINSLPLEIRNTITEINIYDTFNPLDYYWHNEYKDTGNGYFKSAATAGNGQINIWSNSSASQRIIPHEAGHCFDLNGIHSNSVEYVKAVQEDAKITGKNSITDYGENSLAEDFAESIAAYQNGLDGTVDMDQFPNRKAYIEKNLKMNGQNNLSIYNCRKLNEVSETLKNKYGANMVGQVYYEYLTTGDINKITRTDGARDIVSNIDTNEVLEYYNLLIGGA